MKHLKYALEKFEKKQEQPFRNYPPININGNSVTFRVQDGPLSDVGFNGIQVTDMLEFVKDVYVSMNKDHPCRENSLTITKIEEALHWQKARTEDRVARNVEGFNKD